MSIHQGWDRSSQFCGHWVKVDGHTIYLSRGWTGNDAWELTWSYGHRQIAKFLDDGQAAFLLALSPEEVLECVLSANLCGVC